MTFKKYILLNISSGFPNGEFPMEFQSRLIVLDYWSFRTFCWSYSECQRCTDT